MAELFDNIVYLIATFFGLFIIMLIWMNPIHGVLKSTLEGIVNGGTLLPMDADTKNTVLDGFSFVDNSVKLGLTLAILCAFVAVIIFLFLRKEQENQVV